MRLLIATAEPFGAYHLRPLVPAAAAAGIDVRHLLPYPSPAQGQAFPTSCTLADLDWCDLLLITGGTLNPWTSAVALHANTRDIPVVYAELASVTGAALAGPIPSVLAAYPATAHSALVLAEHLQRSVDAPFGQLVLDGLPQYTPLPRRLLALTRVSAEQPVANSALRDALELLQADGWDVVVRPHPREPAHLWSAWNSAADGPLGQHAARAERVLTHPGTSTAVCAALGCAVIVLSGLDTDSDSDSTARLSTPLRDGDDVCAVVRNARPAPAALLAAAVGPVGGAADRLIGLLLAHHGRT